MALQSYMNLRAAHPELRLALVPRHPERGDEVANLIRRFGLNVVRRSQTPPPADTPWNQQTVALIDTVGELKWWWGLSDIAFVGGSMGSRGGQNMLEPAGFGAAVATGPNTVNFRDIVQLLREGDGLVIVADQPSMEAFVRRALIDRDWAEQLGGRAQRIVISHRGATSRTVERLLDVMRPASRQAA
jgi:3-deoxy-D-manno-octulosonic-acid transferase